MENCLFDKVALQGNVKMMSFSVSDIEVTG